MADVRISALPTAQAITGTELVPVVQNGLTVQTTVSAITASPSLTQPFLTVSQQPTLPNSRYFSTGAGIGITDGGAQGAYTISLNGTSGSLETAGTGIVVKTAANTITARSFAVSGSGLSLTNGSGVSGDPTLSLSGLPLVLANTVGTGLLTVNGAALTPLTITGTANEIAVTSGNGSSGNPIIGIASNPVLPGTAAVQVPSGTTAQRAGSLGAFRLNLDTGLFEGYNGSWNAFAAGSGVTSIATGTGLTGGPITSTGTISIDSTVVTLTGTQTLTNKTISGASNTLSNIANASLTNSAITINGTSVSLGGSTTVTAAAPFALTIGTGLSGTSYNGSAAVTVAMANTAVTAAAYGSATQVGTFTVNAQGQLTLAGNTTITPAVGSITGLGTGVATALAVNIGTADSFVVNGGALGTPSSGTVTNLTGTASININGTVGATTAAAGSFTTLNSSGNTRLGGAAGNQSLQVNNVASAVNYAQIVGAATGAAPTISAQGSDANVGLVLNGKGTGVVALGGSTVANSSLQVVTTASSINFAQISGNTVGFGPIIAAAGTDANIAFTMRSKGTFGVTFQSSAGSNIADFLPTFLGFGVNFVRFTNAITGSFPDISAQGSDANINLKLTPKGTGAVTTTASLTATGGISGGTF